MKKYCGSSENVEYGRGDAEGFPRYYERQFSSSFHKIFSEVIPSVLHVIIFQSSDP